MRSVYVRTSCGCESPGIAKLLDREALAKAAAGRAPGRRPVAATEVGRFVDLKAPGLARKLRQVLQDRAGRVAAALARAYKPLAPSEAQKLAKDDKSDRIKRIIEDLSDITGENLGDELEGAVKAAFKKAASKGLTQVGIDITANITKQVDAAAVAYAAKRGGELIKDLAGTTDHDLKALLERAVSDGMSTDELGDAVRSLGAFGEARAESIARTELAFAHVQGNVRGWRESGEVVGKRSILGDNHDIDDQCDACEEAGVVGFDDNFFEDYGFPPYHPNCVCDVLPVLGDGKGDDE